MGKNIAQIGYPSMPSNNNSEELLFIATRQFQTSISKAAVDL